jgi:hypothetical protein
MMFREGSAEGSRRKYTEEPTSHVRMNSGSLYTIHRSDPPQLQMLVFRRGPNRNPNGAAYSIFSYNIRFIFITV